MADEIDRAQALEEAERDRALRRLKQAKQRRGSGICTVCEEPIEPARMEALPSAMRCIECQLDWGRGH